MMENQKVVMDTGAQSIMDNETTNVGPSRVISSTNTCSSDFINAGVQTSESDSTLPRPKNTWIKLDKFDGTSSFETFMAQFNNCREYNKWTDTDCLAQLKAGLSGIAAQILWDSTAIEVSTFDSLMKLLKSRFGSEHQSEKFRTELQIRKRNSGESLTSLFSDIRRLMVLAYPGLSHEAMEKIARDYFINALDEPLFGKVRERDCVTITDALQVSLRLEALIKTVPKDVCDDYNKSQNIGKRVCGAAGDNNNTDSAVLSQLREMRQMMERDRNEIKQQLESERKEFTQKINNLEEGLKLQSIKSVSPTPVSTRPVSTISGSESVWNKEVNHRPNVYKGRPDNKSTRYPPGCLRCGSELHRVVNCPVSVSDVRTLSGYVKTVNSDTLAKVDHTNHARAILVPPAL